MALRLASFLGASCLSGQPWFVLSEGDVEKEYFPLSGGIDNGVTVTIKATKILAEGAMIEFVDRTRRSAFTFELRADSIRRSAHAEFGGPDQTFGAWPNLNRDVENTFVFTKTKFDITVSIKEGDAFVRYPWFDYANVQENEQFPLLTHVAVSAGLTDAEVTLERPTCTQECHPDVCRDAEFKNVCLTGTCVAVQIGTGPGIAASCTDSGATTPGGDMHCCDGLDVTPRPRGSLTPPTDGLPPLDGTKKWATVSSSAGYLQRVCAAFSATCPAELAGQKVEVQKGPTDMSYNVFAPSQQTGQTVAPDHDLMPEAFFDLPSFALFDHHTNRQVTVEVGALNTDVWDVDTFHEIIVLNTQVAGVSVGQFVDLVRFDEPVMGTERLTRMTRRVRGITRSNTHLVYASDIPIEPGACEDLPFYDENGNNCADYTAGGWCTLAGYPSEAGCTHWDSIANETHPSLCLNVDNGVKDPLMPRGKDLSIKQETGGQQWGSNAAGVTCCACGGGTNTLPEGWAAGAPTPAPPAQPAPTEAPAALVNI